MRLVQIAMVGAGTLAFLIPASAQFGGIGDRIRDRAEQEAREAAEREIARTLFPLEEEGAVMHRQAPQLDGIDFGAASNMSVLARTLTGGFVLTPGYWTFRAQAFCLRAGTYERPGGRGYLSGVPGGELAPYIQSILASAYAHPAVDQRDIQELLWGLIAGLDLSEVTERARAAARVLLSAREYAELADEPAWVPPQLSAQAISLLPPAVRNVLNARERLRRLAARPDATYADLERIAVLRGEPPGSDDDDDVPPGRWSWHPDGFHIRYSTTSYRWVDVEIVVGERLTIARDDLGRIVEIGLPDGTYIRASYRDDVDPYIWSEAPGIAAYAFASVEVGSPDPDGGPMRSARSENEGFTWVTDRRQPRAEVAPLGTHATPGGGIRLSVAASGDQLSALARYPAYAVPDARLRLAASSPRRVQIPVIDIQEAQARYDEARELQEFIQDRIDAATDPYTDDDIDRMLDLDHFYEGAKTLVGDPAERVEWLIETHERITRAIGRATERIEELGEDGTDAGASADDGVGAGDGAGADDGAPTGGRDETTVDLSRGTVMPAARPSQMRGMTGRAFEG